MDPRCKTLAGVGSESWSMPFASFAMDLGRLWRGSRLFLQTHYRNSMASIFQGGWMLQSSLNNFAFVNKIWWFGDWFGELGEFFFWTNMVNGGLIFRMLGPSMIVFRTFPPGIFQHQKIPRPKPGTNLSRWFFTFPKSWWKVHAGRLTWNIILEVGRSFSF